jgi:hypothetical protein
LVSAKLTVSIPTEAAPVPATAFPAQAVRVKIEIMSVSKVIKFFILKYSYSGTAFLMIKLVKKVSHDRLVAEGDR